MALKEEIIAAWRNWRDRQTDESYRQIATGSKLERRAIYTACGISRSALGQNEIVAEELGTLENELRIKGILTPLKAEPFALKQEDMTPISAAKPMAKAEDKEKDLLARKDQEIRRLEERNVALQNEIRDLRDENKGLKKEIAILTNQKDAREEYFLETGRQAR